MKRFIPYDGHFPIDKDIKRFIELAQMGGVYEEIMEKGQIIDRDEAKTLFFAGFFGDPKATRRWEREYVEKAQAKLWRIFPSVGAFADRVKSKDYRELARQLQRAESDFVIQTVCRYLMENHPDVPIWTIHDSLLTTPQHVLLVHAAMEALADEHLGMVPQLKIEELRHPVERPPKQPTSGPRIDSNKMCL